MKIAVAIKQVPARDSQFRISSSGRSMEPEELEYEINEPDAYALEEGLQLKEKYGGEVIALCAGPARAAQVLREALAKGADRAIHVEEENMDAFDPLATGRLLAAAIRGEAADLVLTGLQSDDLGYGQTGIVMAEALGLPHATIVMEVEVNEREVRVKRELEDGWFQRVDLPLPALLTIQSGIKKLRYATLMGIKKAKTREVRRVTAADLSAAAAPSGIAVERIYFRERTKQTQFFEGSPAEAAAKLVEKLRFEARVL